MSKKIIVKGVDEYVAKFRENALDVFFLEFDENGLFSEDEYYEALQIEVEKQNIPDLLLFFQTFSPETEDGIPFPSVYGMLDTVKDSLLYPAMKAIFIGLGVGCLPNVDEANALINTYEDKEIRDIIIGRIFATLTSEFYLDEGDVAEKWLEYGLKEEYEDAYNLRATKALHDNDIDNYLKYAHESDEKGFLHGSFMLGFYYSFGSEDTPQDIEKGLPYLHKALEIAKTKENKELISFIGEIITQLEQFEPEVLA